MKAQRLTVAAGIALAMTAHPTFPAGSNNYLPTIQRQATKPQAVVTVDGINGTRLREAERPLQANAIVEPRASALHIAQALAEHSRDFTPEEAESYEAFLKDIFS